MINYKEIQSKLIYFLLAYFMACKLSRIEKVSHNKKFFFV